MLLERLSAAWNAFKGRRAISVAKQHYISGKISLIDFAQVVGKYDGSKSNFLDGFGLTADMRFVDLQTLQIRSLQLARENGYAAAIFERLETKVINTGLRLRCKPNSDILAGIITEKDLQEWTGNTEALWDVWSRDMRLCSVRGDQVFGTLQRQAFSTAMISGDCLCIIGLNAMGLPVIELVDGINIKSPGLWVPANGNRIVHGVELDKTGREVAYYVENENETLTTPQRIDAWTPRGKRRAWLIRINEGRINEVRGMPLLSVVMQNINELGKYLDSEQRAALVNSYIAMTHTRGDKTPLGSDPLRDAILHKGQAATTETDSTGATSAGTNLTFGRMAPGFLATQLAPGERIEAHATARPNVNFASFAKYCIEFGSAALGIPPEILLLSFNSNYSASRQAVLQMDEKVKKTIDVFAISFTQRVYEMWLDGMVLNGRIVAPGYIESMTDVRRFDIIGAWRNTKWRGLPRNDVDTLKMMKSFQIAIQEGFETRDSISDEWFGTDFDDNIRRLTYENKALLDARGGLYDGVKSAEPQGNDTLAALTDKLDALTEMIASLQGAKPA